jgi:hypothetical protein
MATTQQMREGEAELAWILRRVARGVTGRGAEAMASSPVHPQIQQFCGVARNIVARLAPYRGGRMRGAQIRQFGRDLANSKSDIDMVAGRVRNNLNSYSIRDLDILLGCFGSAIDQAFRSVNSRPRASLGTLRAIAAQRMQQLQAGAPRN